MGQVSDPYEQDQGGELDLTISGLPDEPEEPDDVVNSGPDEPVGDFDDADDVVEEAEDDLDADVDADADLDADDDLDDEPDDTDDSEDDDLEDDSDDTDDSEDDDLEDEVAYDLEEFDDDQLDALFDALDEEAIPYLWDGDELFVQASDEQAVDQLLERVANPNALPADNEDGDGGGWLLGELFVVADRLQHDPEEHESVAMLLQLANAADEADAPYGLEEAEWEHLREQVTALATILEQEKPDPDATLESARELRNAIRPYV